MELVSLPDIGGSKGTNMDRYLMAYLILGLMAAGMAAFVAWRLYHSRDRKMERRRSREQAYRKRRHVERSNAPVSD
jgi:hypothetical protein